MISDKKKKVVELYNEGKKHYKIRDFKKAKDYFKKALEIDPDDGPCSVFLERSLEYIKDPPSDDWDGVYTSKTK